jgi:hypothetical protein
MLEILRGRWSLLWLLAPPLLFLAPLPLVNHAYLLGPWLLGTTVLTPLFVYLAARRDPVFHRQSAPSPDDADATR